MVSSFGVGQRKWEERSTRAGLREVTFSSGKGAKEKRICKELVVILMMVMITMIMTSPGNFP